MKMEFLLLAFLLIGSSTSFAAGGVDGGGGKSIVCRHPDGRIKSTEVLDLYEGQIVHKLFYQESPKPWSDQIDDVLKNSGLSEPTSRFGTDILRFLPVIKSKMHFLPDDTELNEVDDSHEPINRVNCKAEQTVNYLNDNLILVSGLIWKSLSETQKAALVLHEAIYRVLREETPAEKNSKRSRHFNAFLFSGGKVNYPTFLADVVLCAGIDEKTGTRTSFYVQDVKNNHPSIHFLTLNSRRLFSLSSLIEYQKESNVIADWNLPDQLLNPTGRTHIVGKTSSAIEADDRISLTILKQDEYGPNRVLLIVKSARDNSESTTYLSCQDMRNK